MGSAVSSTIDTIDGSTVGMADLGIANHPPEVPSRPPDPQDDAPEDGNHPLEIEPQPQDQQSNDPGGVAHPHLFPNHHPRLQSHAAPHEYHTVQMPNPHSNPPDHDPNHRECLRAREEWCALRTEYDKVKADFIAVNGAYISAKRRWQQVQARDSLMHSPDSRCAGAEAYFQSQKQIYRAAKRQYLQDFPPLRTEYRVRRHECHTAWDRYKAHREVCPFYIAKKKVEDEKAKEAERTMNEG